MSLATALIVTTLNSVAVIAPGGGRALADQETPVRTQRAMPAEDHAREPARADAPGSVPPRADSRPSGDSPAPAPVRETGRSQSPVLPWREYQFADLLLAADFPVQPTRQDAGSAMAGAPKNEPAISLISAEAGKRVYLVVRVDMGPTGRPAPKQATRALDESVIGKLKQGQILSERAMTFPGGIGRELTVRQGDQAARMRLYSRWPQMWAVIAAAPADDPVALTDPQAERFLGAFKLLPPRKPPSAAPARRAPSHGPHRRPH